MSKSRKGKKAVYNITVKQCEKIINKKFSKCPFDLRKELFITLEKWANEELNEEARKMFLKALYNAPITQEIQLLIGLNKAFNKINK